MIVVHGGVTFLGVLQWIVTLHQYDANFYQFIAQCLGKSRSLAENNWDKNADSVPHSVAQKWVLGTNYRQQCLNRLNQENFLSAKSAFFPVVVNPLVQFLAIFLRETLMLLEMSFSTGNGAPGTSFSSSTTWEKVLFHRHGLICRLFVTGCTLGDHVTLSRFDVVHA